MEPEKPEPTYEQALVTHIRASTLRGLFREIDARGPAVHAELVDALSEPARLVFQELPGPFQWVETPLINELTTAFEARFGLDHVERRVQYTAQQQLTVIHAWMMKLLSPETLFHQAPTLYRFNYRGGAARAEVIRPGFAQVSIWSRGLYPSWYTHALPSWLAGALRLVGAASAQVLHLPPGDGYHHRFEATWSR